LLQIKSNDTRRITVSEFKGNTLISIREYYKDKESGVMRPGKKGIALTMEQWNALMAAAPLLEGVLKEKGETVSRPNYEGESETLAKKEDDEEVVRAVGKVDEEEVDEEE
jgi:hypothetical protein